MTPPSFIQRVLSAASLVLTTSFLVVVVVVFLSHLSALLRT